MTNRHHNLDAALDAMLRGELDQLSADDVARLEGMLNSRPDLAAKLNDAPAAPEPRLRRTLSVLDEDPAQEQWDAAWQRIHMNHAGSRPTHRPMPRLFRLSGPIVAAAACLVLTFGWSAQGPHRTKPNPWPMNLAADVRIDSLEVDEDFMPMILTVGEDGGGDIIWVVEDET